MKNDDPKNQTPFESFMAAKREAERIETRQRRKFVRSIKTEIHPTKKSAPKRA